MTRSDKLIVLLWSLHDFTPGPKSALRTTAGFAPPERWSPCDHCAGLGVVPDRFRRPTPCPVCAVECPDCAGTGFDVAKDAPCGRCKTTGLVAAPRHKGEVKLDEMDSDRQPVGSTETGVRTKPARTVRCDGCDGTGVGGAHLDELGREYRDPCRHCGGSGRRTVAVFDLSLERKQSDGDTRLEDALERREDAGSYRELDRALADLKAAWPSLHRAVVDALVSGDPEALKLTLVERAGVPFLLARMPEPIRVSGAVVRAWKAARERRALAVGRGAGRVAIERRDKDIRSLVRQGKPAQWVAAEFGLTVARVNQITFPDRHAA